MNRLARYGGLIMFGPNYSKIPELRDLPREEQRRWWRSGSRYAMNRWWFTLPWFAILFCWMLAVQTLLESYFNKWQFAIALGLCMIPLMFVTEMLVVRIARPYWREVQAGRRFLGDYTIVRQQAASR